MTKKVLITGGQGDIAKAVTRQLEAEGYIVYAPSRALMDVTDWNSIESAFEWFRPDILINNAGYVMPVSVKHGDLTNTKKHLDINIGGTFYCTEIGLKYNPELSIINIGSAVAVDPRATWSDYCAAKAAVVMATKCWAKEGLYAVVISPGRTRTKMRKNLFPDEDQSTLLDPESFARIVVKAVHKDYKTGTHLIVRKQNVEEMLEHSKIDWQ